MRALPVLLLALASCTPADEAPTLRVYGQLTQEALCRACAWELPADPWPCVRELRIGEACPGTHGCYYPDERAIYSTPEALPHELAHAAAECAWGHPDYAHAAEVWRR